MAGGFQLTEWVVPSGNVLDRVMLASRPIANGQVLVFADFQQNRGDTGQQSTSSVMQAVLQARGVTFPDGRRWDSGTSGCRASPDSSLSTTLRSRCIEIPYDATAPTHTRN
jgi:hypothetical protein